VWSGNDLCWTVRVLMTSHTCLPRYSYVHGYPLAITFYLHVANETWCVRVDLAYSRDTSPRRYVLVRGYLSVETQRAQTKH
jgi:hypothetical protein